MGLPENGPSIFRNAEEFRAAREMAVDLAAADIVPSAYRGNVGNCLLALDTASRNNLPVLQVMRTLHIEPHKKDGSGAVEGAASATSSSASPASIEPPNAAGAVEPKPRRQYKKRGGGESSAENVTTQQQSAAPPPPEPPAPEVKAAPTTPAPAPETAAGGEGERQPGDLF